jgi:hypothetical protein
MPGDYLIVMTPESLMTPVTFTCRETLALASADIAGQILDLARWPEFTGYGPLPGIQSAQFEVRTPEVVGTRIRVTNTDGSTHAEEIVEWKPNSRLVLHMADFSPPLSRLATWFEEEWGFEPAGDATRVARTFRLYQRSVLTRPAVWLISLLLRRAVARHLRQIKASAGQPG